MHHSIAFCVCISLATIGRAFTLPSTLLKEKQSVWFDLFAEDGSIKKEELEKFPLYEYVYEKHVYGNQIWSDCSECSNS